MLILCQCKSCQTRKTGLKAELFLHDVLTNSCGPLYSVRPGQSSVWAWAREATFCSNGAWVVLYSCTLLYRSCTLSPSSFASWDSCKKTKEMQAILQSVFKYIYIYILFHNFSISFYLLISCFNCNFKIINWVLEKLSAQSRSVLVRGLVWLS